MMTEYDNTDFAHFIYSSVSYNDIIKQNTIYRYILLVKKRLKKTTIL